MDMASESVVICSECVCVRVYLDTGLPDEEEKENNTTREGECCAIRTKYPLKHFTAHRNLLTSRHNIRPPLLCNPCNVVFTASMSDGLLSGGETVSLQKPDVDEQRNDQHQLRKGTGHSRLAAFIKKMRRRGRGGTSTQTKFKSLCVSDQLG